MTIAIRSRKLRILDFDIENRPLSYLGSDFTTGEITAVAWSFGDEVEHALLTRRGWGDGLKRFLEAYEQAGIVTGHFIRKHDLKAVNGLLLEQGLVPLGACLSSDTCLDLRKTALQSRSQESLCAMLGSPHPKVHMTQHDWREANRLTPVGLQRTAARVMGDVIQHMWLRKRLVELGWLGAPKVWRP